MKTIVIYMSKTGFVKKYAEWIAAELSADIFEAAKVTGDMLSSQWAANKITGTTKLGRRR